MLTAISQPADGLREKHTKKSKPELSIGVLKTEVD